MSAPQQKAKTLSLLERIKQAQKRERQSSSSSSLSGAIEEPPVVLDDASRDNFLVPNYAETATKHDNRSDENGESMFSTVLMGGLSSMSGSLNYTMPLETDGADADDSLMRGLLSDAADEEGLVIIEEEEPPMVSLGENYSMSAYFKMFVMDVYRVFQRLPPPARVVLIILLLWILWELL
jgi:hypothetical protein